MKKRLTGPLSWEGEKTKGSRFIVSARTVRTATEANAFLAVIRRQYPKCNHHCFAYVLSSGEQKSSDDGEPRGSAGQPIMLRLQHHNLVDTIVVVSRIFGGTKLGIGGLVRAYGGAAGKALESTTLEVIIPTIVLSLSFEYKDESIATNIRKQFDIELISSDYATDVKQTWSLAFKDLQPVKDMLRSRSQGRIRWTE